MSNVAASDENETPRSAASVRVRSFFEEMLPAVIALRTDLFDRATGTLSILVEGTGAWLLRFGDHAAEDALTEEPTLDADCICVFTTPAFTTLLDGSKPNDAPIVIGDEGLLSLLGQLITGPAKGGLGARLAAR
jgi:hypothetical protein